MSAQFTHPTDFPLTQLTFHLSEGYSLTCRHCWVPSQDAPGDGTARAEQLTVRAVEQALHEALPLGLRSVRLSGSPTARGDVLLHPEIDTLLDRLESLELRVEVETGGAGLTRARAERLARLPRCEVVIGLDGANAAAHDALHLPGAFEIATGAARLLAQAGRAPQILFSVLRSNAHQIPAAIRLAGELGAHLLRFVPARPGRAHPGHSYLDSAGNSSAMNGAHSFNANYASPLPSDTIARANGTASRTGQTGSLLDCALPNPARMGTAPLIARRNTGSLAGGLAPLGVQSSFLRVEELIALGRKVERELARSAPLALVFDQPPAFRGLHASASVDGQGRSTILNSLSVLPGGWYALCGMAQGIGGSNGSSIAAGSTSAAGSSSGSSSAAATGSLEQVFGKVGADSLGRIWREHPTLLLLRESMPGRLEGICARCLMKSTCLGYCPFENYQNTGSFWTPYWFCEAAERAGLFPASRLIENSW